MGNVADENRFRKLHFAILSSSSKLQYEQYCYVKYELK